MATYNTNSTTAEYGNQNQAVADLQTYLNTKGAGLAVDSKYGKLTQAAVAQYGLPPSMNPTTPPPNLQPTTGPGNIQPTSGPTVSPTNPAAPLTAGSLQTTMNGADPAALIAANNGTKKISDIAGNIAGATFSGTKQSIADLKQAWQDQIAADKAQTEANVNAYKGELAKDIGGTQLQDALVGQYDQFQIKEKIQQLTDIQQKIADAQEALNMGIIYERDRPAKMQLLVGREASLQRQGLATIGALQATASVIKGNIELGKAYADQVVSAISDDMSRSTNALKTLLEMENSKLVTLTADEKKLLMDRIGDIEAQQKSLESNKNSLSKLMLDNPYAFQKGGVTMLDSYETAIQKMLPYLSQQEQQKVFGSNDLDLLSGYLADVDSFTDQASALADLEAQKNLIISEVGQDGYDQIVAAVNAKFGGGGGSTPSGSGNYGKGPYANVDVNTRAKQLFNQGIKTPAGIKTSLINSGYSFAAAQSAANQYYTTTFDQIIGNIGDSLFND